MIWDYSRVGCDTVWSGWMTSTHLEKLYITLHGCAPPSSSSNTYMDCHENPKLTCLIFRSLAKGISCCLKLFKFHILTAAKRMWCPWWINEWIWWIGGMILNREMYMFVENLFHSYFVHNRLWHGLAPDEIWVSNMKGQWLTPWARAQPPNFEVLFHSSCAFLILTIIIVDCLCIDMCCLLPRTDGIIIITTRFLLYLLMYFVFPHISYQLLVFLWIFT